MTNPLKGEMMITLGEQEYKTRLTIDAIIKIEEQLDRGILSITQRLAEADIRVQHLCVILYHALRGGGNDISEKQVKTIVDKAGLVPCCQAVAELLTAALMRQQAAKADEPE